MNATGIERVLPVKAGVSAPGPDLAGAVLATLAYGDLFDHPLTAAEVHRDLVATPSTLREVTEVLETSPALRGCVAREGTYFTLAGRAGLGEIRRRREAVAARMWPEARRWGRVLAALPFVRLVAVTGALAVDAVDPGADIDYLVVARSGRVWLCRALVTAMARAARATGVRLCPNYVLSEGALALADRTLYTAHELVQMVPLAGRQTWARMRAANPWVAGFLPNGEELPPLSHAPGVVGGAAARTFEAALRGRIGDRLEAWVARWQGSHLRRKIERGELSGREVAFGSQGYKGHFDAHGARILAAWNARLNRLRGVWG